MKKVSKYILLFFIVITLFLISGCLNNYSKKTIMDETRNYINEIVSGTYLTTQSIVFKNENEKKVKEFKLIILPNSSKQTDFNHKNFKFKIIIKLENDIIEIQEINLMKDPGIDSYNFQLNLLNTTFKLNLVFCKNKIVLYTANHQQNTNDKIGIFYSELAIFLNKEI